MITKSKFIKIINKLQQATKLQEDMYKLLKQNSDITDGVDCGIVICHEQIVVDLLNHIFKQDRNESWVSYFIYEGNYGQSLQVDSVQEEDGTPIDITTAEKLYDFLIEEIKKKEQLCGVQS